MINEKQKLTAEIIDAGREIANDFHQYGEVLQLGDNGEYGTESAIGKLTLSLKALDDLT